MGQTFGEALRSAREKAGKTLADVAKHLGLSVAYISDVERGARYPLTEDRIMSAAAYLEAPPAPLLRGRAESDGFWRLGTGLSEHHDRLAARLVARWGNMSPEAVECLFDAIGPPCRPDEDGT